MGHEPSRGISVFIFELGLVPFVPFVGLGFLLGSFAFFGVCLCSYIVKKYFLFIKNIKNIKKIKKIILVLQYLNILYNMIMSSRGRTPKGANKNDRTKKEMVLSFHL